MQLTASCTTGSRLGREVLVRRIRQWSRSLWEDIYDGGRALEEML
jgi:hypothetical protein